jgi:hypothetical protein
MGWLSAPRLTAGDLRFPAVLARMWHGGTF